MVGRAPRAPTTGFTAFVSRGACRAACALLYREDGSALACVLKKIKTSRPLTEFFGGKAQCIAGQSCEKIGRSAGILPAKLGNRL